VSIGKLQDKTYSKEMVRQSFDGAAQGYNDFTSLQRLIGDRLMTHGVLKQHTFSSVLDVGSGTGYLTNKLSHLSGVDQLYALDIAVGMLYQTRHHLGEYQAKGLICADAECLPFNEGVFDMMTSNLAFQWCENLEAVFRQAYRVLHSSGALVFSTFGPTTLFELKESWGAVDEAVHVNSFVDVDVIRQNLQLAGFKNITIVSDDIVRYYESPKALMRSLKGMGAHNMNRGRRLGLTGVQTFKAMLNTYECLRTEQGIPATFQAVYVSANK